MGLNGKKLCILVPMYGGQNMQNFFESFTRLMLIGQALKLNWTFYQNFLELHKAAVESGAKNFPVPPPPQIGTAADIELAFMTVYNESLISRARNTLVDDFLKQSDSTHALFIDADIGFDPMDVLCMLEMDKDIVGAPCPKKRIAWERIQAALRKNGRTFTDEEMARLGGDFVFNFEKADHSGTMQMDKPHLMRNLGTGILMIKRSVFERFKDYYPDRWYEPKADPTVQPGPIWDFFRVGINPENREYESEDYCFCLDSKAFGAEVWMCPWMNTSHMGAFLYRADLPAVAALIGNL